MKPQVGYFIPLGSAGHPDQGLPGVEGPVDPGYGVDVPPQIWPPDSLPPLPPGINPPVGIWPPTRPTVPSHPIVIPGRPPHPDQGLPGLPGRPDQGLPGAPGRPDQGLPGAPGRPDQGLPGTPPSVDNTLPMPPATIWPPLPPGIGIAGKALILVWVVGVGYRWLVVEGPDVWPPLPSVQPPIAQPPVAQPK
jgi:hypothetical protein